jgi:hypothetical protein
MVEHPYVLAHSDRNGPEAATDPMRARRAIVVPLRAPDPPAPSSVLIESRGGLVSRDKVAK